MNHCYSTHPTSNQPFPQYPSNKQSTTATVPIQRTINHSHSIHPCTTATVPIQQAINHSHSTHPTSNQPLPQYPSNKQSTHPMSNKQLLQLMGTINHPTSNEPLPQYPSATQRAMKPLFYMLLTRELLNKRNSKGFPQCSIPMNKLPDRRQSASTVVNQDSTNQS